MMMDETGEKPYVVGRSMDIAPTGPIPGRTPTRVPMNTPIKQNKKFMGLRTV
jgi:hypothetical protein